MPPADLTSSGDNEPTSARGLTRVLIVDDDPDTVTSLLAILRDEGYDARGVADPRRALGVVEALKPDVVIVDIAMPVVTGWDIAREIRERPGKKPMLIAISGVQVKSTDQMLSRHAGFNFFLQKPCEPSFLLNILAAIPKGK